jgi:hypothetical protein
LAEPKPSNESRGIGDDASDELELEKRPCRSEKVGVVGDCASDEAGERDGR